MRWAILEDGHVLVWINGEWELTEFLFGCMKLGMLVSHPRCLKRGLECRRAGWTGNVSSPTKRKNNTFLARSL